LVGMYDRSVPARMLSRPVLLFLCLALVVLLVLVILPAGGIHPLDVLACGLAAAGLGAAVPPTASSPVRASAAVRGPPLR